MRRMLAHAACGRSADDRHVDSSDRPQVAGRSIQLPLSGLEGARRAEGATAIGAVGAGCHLERVEPGPRGLAVSGTLAAAGAGA